MRTSMLILSTALLLTACGAAPVAAPVENTQSALWGPAPSWSLCLSDVERSWATDVKSDLSDWKTLDCPAQFGDFVLTAITATNSPLLSGSPHIAKLEGTCSEFGLASQESATLYSKTSRTVGRTLDILDRSRFSASENGPLLDYGMVGSVILGLDAQAGFVKNLGFTPKYAYVWRDADSASWYGNPYASVVTLGCATDNMVVTSIAVRHDSDGKIRAVRTHCRALAYH